MAAKKKDKTKTLEAKTNSMETDKLEPIEQKDKLHKTNGTSSINFPVVGIGASAGGLEALEQFFENTPNNSGMAFVVIQHLDPNHPGICQSCCSELQL